jgi:hypothetical protein
LRSSPAFHAKVPFAGVLLARLHLRIARLASFFVEGGAPMIVASTIGLNVY